MSRVFTKYSYLEIKNAENGKAYVLGGEITKQLDFIRKVFYMTQICSVVNK